MHDQMCVTAGTIYIQMLTRFVWNFGGQTVDIAQVRRLTGGSARALPIGNLLTREMSTGRANKMTKNRVTF